MSVSDAAKRASGEVNLQVALSRSNVGRWLALRLSDGGSDGVAYDTRADAVRHQLHESQCAYVKIPPGGMPPEHAERFLAFHRKAYDAGFRLTDPDDRREVIMPHTIETMKGFLR